MNSLDFLHDDRGKDYATSGPGIGFPKKVIQGIRKFQILDKVINNVRNLLCPKSKSVWNFYTSFSFKNTFQDLVLCSWMKIFLFLPHFLLVTLFVVQLKVIFIEICVKGIQRKSFLSITDSKFEQCFPTKTGKFEKYFIQNIFSNSSKMPIFGPCYLM